MAIADVVTSGLGKGPVNYLVTEGFGNYAADEAMRATRTGRGRKAVRPLPYYLGLDITLTGPGMPELEALVTHAAPAGVPQPSRSVAPAPRSKVEAPAPYVAPVPPPQAVRRVAVTMALPPIPEWRASMVHRDVELEAVESLIRMIEAYD